jgi:hypothetical protein
MLCSGTSVRQGIVQLFFDTVRSLMCDLQDNGNILRDAANLQSQLRHFDALQESRLILFRQRPNVRLNWLSLAVAYHLNGNRQNAKKVLEHYEATVKVMSFCHSLNLTPLAVLMVIM